MSFHTLFKYYFYLVALLIASVQLIDTVGFGYRLYSTDFIKQQCPDYLAFMSAAHIVKDGNIKDLYSEAVQRSYQRELPRRDYDCQFLPFMYLPISVLLFLPFSYLPYHVSYVLAGFYSVIAFIFGLFILFRGSKYLPLLILVSLSSLSLKYSVMLVHPAPFIFLILASVFKLILTKRDFAAGLVASLLMIRPHLYFFGLPLLAVSSGNKKEYVTGCLIGTSGLVVANILMYGRDFMVGMMSMMRLVGGAETRLFEHNAYFSLQPVLSELVAPNVPMYLYVRGMALILLFVLALYFLAKNRDKMPIKIAFSVSLVLLLMFSYHVTAADFLLILLPIYILFVHFSEKIGPIYQVYLLFMLVYLLANVLVFLNTDISSSRFGLLNALFLMILLAAPVVYETKSKKPS
ncbi:hypothetical protein A2415_05010 [candidate division WWE3 bacterium RIFOXYC1_FULL_39_7]|uniref:DUF2029 domain-containing protein n=1 Tax=candidate division WWE3 bacterium RIFOXYC1_FULL_39_7 TaxID=1802643 RepID=A0A1F4WKC5_UNCKA|nr:MAG: hypothetical protein A2415_05010 [candidate division WWE3 bacterium RIFOXYC1_FULL_39_7]